MTIFVTGGTGLIGSRVVRLLVEQGETVRCLTRGGRRLDRIRNLDVTVVRGDLDDMEVLRAAAAGSDACVHLAGISGWDQMADHCLDNVTVDGTQRVLLAAKEAGVDRFLYVSSAAAIGATTGPVCLDESASFNLDGSRLWYAIAKHRAETAVLQAAAAGLNAAVVNPAETYGPDDDDWVTAGNIRDILTSWPALALRGGASVVHADDVAAGIVGALRRGRRGERYILGGDNLELGDIVHLVLRLAELRRPVVTVPFALVKGVVSLCQACGLKPPLEPGVLDYLRRYWFVDSAKARKELDYRPRPASEVFEPVVRWIRGQLGRDRRKATPTATAAGSETLGGHRS
jgi:dihydroflavonol-4-reductase